MNGRATRGGELDFVAAQGYEAVKIIAAACDGAESLAPIDLASVLRSGADFVPLPGTKVHFRLNGDIVGKDIFVRLINQAGGG